MRERALRSRRGTSWFLFDPYFLLPQAAYRGGSLGLKLASLSSSCACVCVAWPSEPLQHLTPIWNLRPVSWTWPEPPSRCSILSWTSAWLPTAFSCPLHPCLTPLQCAQSWKQLPRTPQLLETLHQHPPSHSCRWNPLSGFKLLAVRSRVYVYVYIVHQCILFFNSYGSFLLCFNVASPYSKSKSCVDIWIFVVSFSILALHQLHQILPN